jgi:uncharacterized protein (UPF0333 family)
MNKKSGKKTIGKKAQTSLEILLLIGGIIVITLLVVAILSSISRKTGQAANIQTDKFVNCFTNESCS